MLTVTLFALLCWLQYHLWWGKNGVFDYNEFNRVAESIALTNKDLEARNQEMYAEIGDLKGGLEAIEERARNELGMIKPDENFFRIVDE